MRRIIVAAFVSLDGVMQAPGGPNEDTEGGFVHGGWVVPYVDQAFGDAMGELFSRPFEPETRLLDVSLIVAVRKLLPK
jgi:hypothetical protein